jgi:hypothetical protein
MASTRDWRLESLLGGLLLPDGWHARQQKIAEARAQARRDQRQEEDAGRIFLPDLSLDPGRYTPLVPPDWTPKNPPPARRSRKGRAD